MIHIIDGLHTMDEYRKYHQREHGSNMAGFINNPVPTGTNTDPDTVIVETLTANLNN